MKSMLAAAVVLARKDILSFVRDRGALMLSVLVPLALVTVFGWIMAYAFGGSGGMPRVTLHVADADGTSTSQRFLTRLQQQDMLKVVVLEVKSSSDVDPLEQRVQRMIEDGDAHHVLILSQGFERQVQAGETPPLAMFRDPGRSMEEQMIQLALVQACFTDFGDQLMLSSVDRILEQQGMEESQIRLIRNWMSNIGTTISAFIEASRDDRPKLNENATAETDLPDNALAETTVSEASGSEASGSEASGAKASGAKASGDVASADIATAQGVAEDSAEDGGVTSQMLRDMLSQIVPMQSTDVSPPNRSRQVTYQQAQSVAGMSVMMLLFALTSCGSVLLKEREDGTLKRLFAQPIERRSILLGKFLFVFAIGAAQLAILFTYGEWMFRVGLFRDPMTLLVLSVTWVATGGAFGLFLAAVSRSSKQAEGLASLLILMMAALGGCWFPLQLMNLPVVLEAICKSTMTYWAMTGFQGMLWNQLAWYEPKMLVALGWQWGWLLALSTLSIAFFKRNYCRG
jgi:ABC-type Na+ efflux pump permease subunit